MLFYVISSKILYKLRLYQKSLVDKFNISPYAVSTFVSVVLLTATFASGPCPKCDPT